METETWDARWSSSRYEQKSATNSRHRPASSYARNAYRGPPTRMERSTATRFRPTSRQSTNPKRESSNWRATCHAQFLWYGTRSSACSNN